MDIKAKDFVYDTPVVSERQYNQHLILYKGYVNKTNEITRDLENKELDKGANAIYSEYRGLKVAETFAIDGVILHELYFNNMGNKKTAQGPLTTAMMENGFGGYENFKKDFIACCTSARGWCLLVYDARTKSFRNILLDAHNKGQISMAYPIIVMDMYEHAYFIDYGTNKAEYIEKFIEFINWDVVEKRLK